MLLEVSFHKFTRFERNVPRIDLDVVNTIEECCSTQKSHTIRSSQMHYSMERNCRRTEKSLPLYCTRGTLTRSILRTHATLVQSRYLRIYNGEVVREERAKGRAPACLSSRPSCRATAIQVSRRATNDGIINITLPELTKDATASPRAHYTYATRYARVRTAGGRSDA